MSQAMALALTLFATIALCLSMRRHRALIGGRELSNRQRWAIRVPSFAALLAALQILLSELPTLPAIALFFGWWTVAIVLIAAYNTWRDIQAPRR
ncbi:MAG: DUF3325 family protein [Pseudomonadota bacterium]